jgi:hypothetical protein
MNSVMTIVVMLYLLPVEEKDRLSIFDSLFSISKLCQKYFICIGGAYT